MRKKNISSIKEIKWELRLTIFKTCIIAVWTDHKVESDEQHYISHIIEILTNNEKERKELRKINFQELNKEALFNEIKKLHNSEKKYLFEICVDIILSDRNLKHNELTFLKILRKKCGIGYLKYRMSLRRGKFRYKIKISKKVKVGIFFLFLLFAYSVIRCYSHFNPPAEPPPPEVFEPKKTDIRFKEKSNKKDIEISFFDNKNPNIKPLDGEEIFEKVKKGFVSIRVFYNNKYAIGGSGFILGYDDSGITYIITNKHVILSDWMKEAEEDDILTVQVKQPSGAQFDAVLDFYSRDHDLAILAVKGMKEYSKPLSLVKKVSLKVGEKVYALGTPLGLENTFTSGMISAIRDDYIQTDATVSYGSSGGPIFNDRGFVCGVLTRSHNKKDLSFAIYSDTVIEILQKRKEMHLKKVDDSLLEKK